MPLHFLCTLQLPLGILKQFDRIIRQCLWRDFYGEPKQSLASWERVSKPKNCGGLGIVHFQKQNAALLIKFLDKFYNKADLPWVHLIWSEYYIGSVPHGENLRGSFWWRDVLKQVDNFRGVSSIKPGRGDTFLFWLDSWQLDGSLTPLNVRFPRLFSFVLEENLSAAQVFDVDDLTSLFNLPLSRAAFEEFCQLQRLLSGNILSAQKDVWVYCWGSKYTSAKFYRHIHSHIKVPKVYHWLWKSSCTMSAKFFAWLILQDRLNTRDLLMRRHWHVSDDVHCVLCPLGTYEDRIHLFFECNFSRRVWTYLQIDWISNDDLQTVMQAARRSFGKPFFMEVVILACRHIWLLRNGKIFRNERPTFAKWKCNFIHDISLLKYRIKGKFVDSLTSWISSLP
jgi:hypothetical protein